MKKITLVITTVIFSTTVFAQTNSTNINSKNSSGICGLIKEGDAGNAPKKNAALILYIYDSLQNHEVEIVFTENIRKKMSYNPYTKLVNQSVCVTGKLSQFNNAPAIIIQSEKQIKVSSEQQIDGSTTNH